MILGVKARAAIPHSDIEKAVEPELDHPAVVVGIRLINDKKNSLARRGDVGIRGYVIFGDDRGTVRLARVVDKKSGIGPDPELRMKSEPEQTPLVAGEHLGRDIEKHGRRGRARRKNLDAPSLLDNEQSVGIVVCVGDVDGAGEPLQHRIQANRALGRMHHQ